MTNRARARLTSTAFAALLHVVGAGILGLDLGRIADFVGGGVYAVGVVSLVTTWRGAILLYLRGLTASLEGRT